MGSRELQKGNIVAAVWQDKKQVAFLSTLSNLNEQINVTRRVGRNVLNMIQLHCATVYNQKMNGVDRHHQLRMTYSLGRDREKSWKYIFWFVMNCSIVNAFIIFSNSSRRQNAEKKRFTHLDFRIELAHELIAGFCGRKRKGAEQRHTIRRAKLFRT